MRAFLLALVAFIFLVSSNGPSAHGIDLGPDGPPTAPPATLADVDSKVASMSEELRMARVEIQRLNLYLKAMAKALRIEQEIAEQLEKN